MSLTSLLIAALLLLVFGLVLTIVGLALTLKAERRTYTNTLERERAGWMYERAKLRDEIERHLAEKSHIALQAALKSNAYGRMLRQYQDRGLKIPYIQSRNLQN